MPGFSSCLLSSLAVFLYTFSSLCLIHAQLTNIYPTSQCSQLTGLAVNSNLPNVAYFSCQSTNIYMSTGSSYTSIVSNSICPSPRDLLFDPKSNLLFALCDGLGSSNSAVLTIQPSQGYSTLISVTNTQCNTPRGLAIHANTGNVYVGCGSGGLGVFTPNTTNTFTTLVISSSCSTISSLSLNSVTSMAYLFCFGGSSLIVNVSNPTVPIFIPSGSNAITSNFYSTATGITYVSRTSGGIWTANSEGIFQPVSGYSTLSCLSIYIDENNGAFYCGSQGLLVLLEGTQQTVASTSQCEYIFNLAGNTNNGLVWMTCSATAYLLVSTGCQPGSYQNGSTCNFCTPGYYCPTTTYADQTPCPSGNYCPSGSVQPLTCPSGFYCPTQVAMPLPCQPGTYCPGSALASPVNCTHGYYCTGTELISPTAGCQVGFYCPAGSITQLYCLPGTYCPFPLMYTPIPCPPGSYCPFNQATTPGFLCPPGSYCPTYGLSSPGFICPAGTYCPIQSIQPHPCALGSVSSQGSSQCVSCGTGFVVINATCSFCPSGSYAFNSTQCLTCPAGFFCPPGSSTTNACPDPTLYCPAGSISPTLIPSGYYCTQIIGTGCVNYQPCPIGSACLSGLQTICLAGQFSNATLLPKCYDCPYSTFNNASGLSFCYECPLGSFTPTVRSIGCQSCPAGQTIDLTTHQCLSCPVGTYTPIGGLLSCLNCPAGTYTQQAGSVSCISCPFGYYANTSAWSLTSCATCGSGTQSTNLSMSTGCMVCPPGRANQYSHASCLTCLEGTYAHGPANTQCTDCIPGTYAPGIQSTSCLSCMSGFVTNSSGSPGCTACSDGTVSNQDHTSCVVNPCQPGQHLNPLTFQCMACPPHTYNTGETNLCQRCPSNTYTPSWGSRVCIDCTKVSGLDCSQGIPIVQPAYWAFLSFSATQTQAYAIDNTSTPVVVPLVVIQTYPCPVGYCVGGSTIQMISPWTSTTGALYAQAQVSTLPVFPTGWSQTAAAIVGPNQVLQVDSQSSSLVQVQQGCASNRDPSSSNTLCGNCATGYTEWNGQCVSCPTIQVSVLIEYLFVSFIFVFILFILSQKSRSDSKIMIYFVQTALFQFGPANQYIGWLGWLNFNLFQTSGHSCLGTLSPSQLIGFSACIPILFSLELFVVFLCHYGLRKIQHRRIVQQRPQRSATESLSYSMDIELHLEFPFYKYVRTLISIFCFGYLQVASSCINYLYCVNVDNQKVVFKSPSIHCDSSDYTSWFTVVIILLVMEVSAFPLLLGGFLFRYRSKLQEVKFKAYFGILYENYKPHVYMWQCGVLIRQVILIGIATALVTDHESQYTGFIYFNLFILGLHSIVFPNLRLLENRLEAVSHSLLTIVVIFLAPSSPPYNTSRQVAVFMCMVPFVILLALYIVLIRLSTNKYAQQILKIFSLEDQMERQNTIKDRVHQSIQLSQLGLANQSSPLPLASPYSQDEQEPQDDPDLLGRMSDADQGLSPPQNVSYPLPRPESREPLDTDPKNIHVEG